MMGTQPKLGTYLEVYPTTVTGYSAPRPGRSPPVGDPLGSGCTLTERLDARSTSAKALSARMRA